MTICYNIDCLNITINFHYIELYKYLKINYIIIFIFYKIPIF